MFFKKEKKMKPSSDVQIEAAAVGKWVHYGSRNASGHVCQELSVYLHEPHKMYRF
jgi:hypothetical protein